MTVARANRETKPPVEFSRGVEIVHRMNDMIQTARHRHLLFSRDDAASRVEKKIGHAGAERTTRRGREASASASRCGRDESDFDLPRLLLVRAGLGDSLLRARRPVAEVVGVVGIGAHPAHVADLLRAAWDEVQRLSGNGAENSANRDRGGGSKNVTHLRVPELCRTDF